MAANPMREPTCAGTFYDRDPDLLMKEISAHYEGIRGPGGLPLSTQLLKTKAIVVPNSPYNHCGDCMAWGYKAIAETSTPDVYIIIGTNQHSQESGISMYTFNTPLGFMRIDQELARAIVAKGTITVNEEIHQRDHVIEVQLPFLMHAKDKEKEKVKILPILVSKGIDVQQLALDIKECLIDLGREAIYIVSTDFTHYGPLFHYVPFTLDIQKNIYELDKRVIDTIIKQDAKALREVIHETMIVMHGSYSIELLLYLLRPCIVRLDQHYTSGDIINNYKNSVSYAAIVFEEK